MSFYNQSFTPEMAQNVLDSSDQFVGALDLDGRLTFANKTALSFIQAQPQDVLGEYFWDTLWWNFDSALQQKLIALIKKSRESLLPQSLPVQHKSANGIIHHFFFTLKPLLDSTGNLAGFIAEGKDINDLFIAQERLKIETQRYKDLFQNSADAHLIIENNYFIEANNVAVHELGYSDEAELVHIHPSEISPPLQPDGRSSQEKAEAMIALAYRNGSHRFEWVHTKLDGTPLDVEVVLTPINSGDKTLLFVTWRNIAERIIAQRALLQKQTALTKLLVGVSHELGTPLGNALTTSSYLVDMLESQQVPSLNDDELQTCLEGIKGIERNLEHAVALLDYFKSHASGSTTNVENLKPLHALTKEALNE